MTANFPPLALSNLSVSCKGSTSQSISSHRFLSCLFSELPASSFASALTPGTCVLSILHRGAVSFSVQSHNSWVFPGVFRVFMLFGKAGPNGFSVSILLCLQWSLLVFCLVVSFSCYLGFILYLLNFYSSTLSYTNLWFYRHIFCIIFKGCFSDYNKHPKPFCFAHTSCYFT